MVQQQPVVVQQSQPQPMMVQTASGQYVQGTPAIVNGQQVIMVQQPVQQQPIVVQQPMTQTPAQGYPAANGQPVVIMQQQQPQTQSEPGALPGYPGATR